ncbi:MAG: alpha/beta fold hydrolase [Comamonadaceae bacterium]|nr:MAG: alpha/beta fold hydrolase [Comamonadaceae bacterium]
MTQLLLLPGLAGDAAMWQAQSSALADFGPRVTDVHTRFGTIAQMAQTLLEENDGELVLCGASMGGIVAMEVARQAPQRLRGLALLGTNARPETPEMQSLREAAIELFSQGRAAEVIEPNVALAFHPDNARNPALVQTYLDFVLAAGARQLIAQNRAIIGRPDAREHLPQVRCPVLVMCGDADQLTPPECSHEIAALIPAAELVVLPRCGHMLTMEKPEAVNAELRRWLSALLF